MLEQNAEELGAIRKQARRLLEDCAHPEHLKQLLNEPATFDLALWHKAVELGWPSLAIPESVGGLGLGLRGLCLLSEETGRLTASLPLMANALTVHALLNTEATFDIALLEQLVSGEKIASLALSDPEDGSLLLSPSCRYANGMINGNKAMAPFAAVADVALVQAVTEQGMALCLIDLSQPQVQRHAHASIDNARAAAELSFNDAAVTVLGDKPLLIDISRLAALICSFEQIAGAQSCLEMARAYALERKAFGQPIGHFQGIKHKLAEIYCLVELAQGCALSALEAYESGAADVEAQICAARLAAIKAYDHSAQENLHVHGGMGVTWEAMPHHHYRRSRCLALELGPANHWSNRLLSAIGADQNQLSAENA